MLRKHLLTDHPAERVVEPGEKDIATLYCQCDMRTEDYSYDNGQNHELKSLDSCGECHGKDAPPLLDVTRESLPRVRG
jgi:mono/diheme cytochrome c family protein